MLHCNSNSLVRIVHYTLRGCWLYFPRKNCISFSENLFYLKLANSAVNYPDESGAQWLIGRVLDSKRRGRGFEPHRCHCVVVLEQDKFIVA